ncbi:MAG: HAMP domain-containing protein [Candidatus Omnitrophica bacterium]|nr:HAMP domain-containing protein [Candidatus Omnitrophota bacterium]
MSNQKNRRTNYFIKKDFQRKFIIKFCGLVFLGSVISGILLLRFAGDTLTTAFIQSRLTIVSTADYILPGLIGSSLVTLVLVSIATVFVVMYQSHRIAGPLFNLERSAQQIATGDLNLKIKLRSTDEMTKLADCLNEMSKSLQSNIAKIQTHSTELGTQIDSLKGLLGRESALSEKAQETLTKLDEKKEALNSALGYFKI